jgi:acyl-CoA thioesterase-1
MPIALAARFWIATAICVGVCSGAVEAKPIKVFALGASNTNGKGVGSDQAWPAQLERMLRAKGYDARVTVNAINGDTSEGVLRRTSSIPHGTQVVVFDTGGDNDHRQGRSDSDITAARAKIVSAIRARGAVPIQAPYQKLIGPMRDGGAGISGGWASSDFEITCSRCQLSCPQSYRRS